MGFPEYTCIKEPLLVLTLHLAWWSGHLEFYASRQKIVYLYKIDIHTYYSKVAHILSHDLQSTKIMGAPRNWHHNYNFLQLANQHFVPSELTRRLFSLHSRQIYMAKDIWIQPWFCWWCSTIFIYFDDTNCNSFYENSSDCLFNIVSVSREMETAMKKLGLKRKGLCISKSKFILPSTHVILPPITWNNKVEKG